ncbi:MAG: hypothetical protein JRJ14_11145, partial [Deltaproteobacteria bacterium]|nr:hypothetical protein [Deltaproteobacteria bacterium]
MEEDREMSKVKLTVVLLGALLAFAPAVANVTTGSWTMDQSNTFADGINYGQVDISADDDSGVVSFNVEAFIVSSYGDPANFSNFGIQSFGFNHTNLSDAPTAAWFSLPSGWTFDGTNNQDGFGRFLLTTSGDGSTR